MCAFSTSIDSPGKWISCQEYLQGSIVTYPLSLPDWLTYSPFPVPDCLMVNQVVPANNIACVLTWQENLIWAAWRKNIPNGLSRCHTIPCVPILLLVWHWLFRFVFVLFVLFFLKTKLKHFDFFYWEKLVLCQHRLSKLGTFLHNTAHIYFKTLSLISNLQNSYPNWMALIKTLFIIVTMERIINCVKTSSLPLLIEYTTVMKIDRKFIPLHSLACTKLPIVAPWLQKS